VRKRGYDCDVGSSYPGAGEGNTSLLDGNVKVINRLKMEKAYTILYRKRL
jgi:hypothetical protein